MADVTRLVADVASLAVLWTVTRHVTCLVAVVASGVTSAISSPRAARGLGTVASDVPGLVAVVARRLVLVLRTLSSHVTYAAASVATVFFLALACKVTEAVALVAFLSASAAVATSIAAVTTSGAAMASVGTLVLGALPCKVTSAVAPVAYT